MDSKQYYYISEVEKIVNIPQSKLRFWEKNIDKLSPKRSKGSTRKYSAEDIDIIKQIMHLINDCHLSLEGVNQQLNNNSDEVSGTTKTINRLKKIRNTLNDILFELKDKETFTKEFTIPESEDNI